MNTLDWIIIAVLVAGAILPGWIAGWKKASRVIRDAEKGRE